MPAEQISGITPAGLIFTVAMAALLLLLARRAALLPIALITCYMTFGQQLVIAELHFTMLRLLVLAGCTRVIFRKEYRSFRWLRLDSVLVAWIFAGVVGYTLLWQSWGALINRLGVAYDAVGLYFIFRCLIRDMEDIKEACKIFALVLLPVAICMIHEKMTGRNPFYALGGVPEWTTVRDGVLRCQGPFGHPILAGTFGAAWLPLFVGLWWKERRTRVYSIIGIVSSTLITILSGSSGPIAVYGAGILACAMWRLRRYMRAVRWAIVFGIVALHLVMKEPVWFIFARVNIFSASTGWHRANLINQTIRHFGDWWLVGAKDTQAWGVWWGDITNMFILQGVRGGIITMALFVYLVVLGFSAAGLALAAARKQPRRSQLFLWALGCGLFAHVMAFLNVAYFDQNIVNWYLSLAMLAAALTSCRGARKRAPRVRAKGMNVPNRQLSDDLSPSPSAVLSA